jgi:acyl-CoA thioester hydrolase
MNKFNFEIPIQIRYGDFDMLGHLNNAIYITYYEVARIQYFHKIGWELTDVSNVVAHLEIDFLKPVLPKDEITVRVRTTGLGTKSFKMEYEIVSRDGATLFNKAGSTQVCFDKTSGQPLPIPDHIRELLVSYEKLL